LGVLNLMTDVFFTILQMELWSTVFLEESDWATCTVNLATWNRITEENPSTRLFAEITYYEQKIFVALGIPYNNDGSSTEKIYVPGWLLDRISLEGSGQEVEVTWLTQEHFPEASRIVLRPHDSAFYLTDVKDELEQALTRIGVIREGDTLVIPLQSLGGYEITLDVVKTEPANIVLAQGDEVIMEFEEALDTIVTETVTEIPDTTFDPASMLPPLSKHPEGRVLGGEIRYMPDGRRWNPWKDGPWVKDMPHK